jgi:transposase
MYIDIRIRGSQNPVILLRSDHKEGKKVVKKTIANLSVLPLKTALLLKLLLNGEDLIPKSEFIRSFEVEYTKPWGHVNAVLTAMNRLGMDKLIDPNPSHERNIILGIIASRIMSPESKLATVSRWNESTLASELDLKKYNESDVYRAMDWLLLNQPAIEKRLCERHVKDGDLLFVDMSSSYYEGEKSSLINYNNDPDAAQGKNTLVRRGYSRDKKRGKPQVNFALLTNESGCPVSISIFPGNTSDSRVLVPTVEKIKNDFNILKAIMVGDRGMISSKAISEIRIIEGIDWITALRSQTIAKMAEKGSFHFEDKDTYNFTEFTDLKNYPGERFGACLNPELKKKREKTRKSLIDATRKELDKIQDQVSSGKIKGKDKIGLAVGKCINNHKVGKHFTINVTDTSFNYHIEHDTIEVAKVIDGIYIIRTSVSSEVMKIDECIRKYKNLNKVENAFRTMKTIDLRVRPIFHFLDDRIRAHIFLTMLSYYVEWHMREAWKDITFYDTEIEAKKDRHPVAPSVRSDKAKQKVASKQNGDNLPVQKFHGVLTNLSAINEVVVTFKSKKTDQELELTRKPKLTPIQKRAFELLESIPKYQQ